MFKFSRGNAKLDHLEKIVKGEVWTFSLLSGHTCPYAKDCHSKAVPTDTGSRTIVDGEHTLFRCFSASAEAIFTPVYKQREHNTELVKTLLGQGVDVLANKLWNSLPKRAKVIRVHVGGDFFVQSYFDAWLQVAASTPDKLFYAYTKALPFWVKRLDSIPSNFVLTASYGGYRDDLIAKHNLRYAKVVYSKAEARKLKLPIDHDDSHAIKNNGKSFALLIHGVQPKGSKASEALSKLGGHKYGESAYSRK